MPAARTGAGPVQVAIALGSNLGDRRAHLDQALHALALVLSDLRHSTYIETEPLGVPIGQPTYLNAAAVGTTTLGPLALLAQLQAIEAAHARARPYPMAPRTLDLDLILFGEAMIAEPELQVPHPRFRAREFVLEPLAEIAPEMVDPATGLNVGELLARLRYS